MAGVRLSIPDLRAETLALCDIASTLLDDSTLGYLDLAAQQLDGIRFSKPGREVPWTIPLSTPVKTVESAGKYYVEGGGPLNVVGEVSFLWEVTPLNTRGKGNKVVEISGIASTKITIRDSMNGRELAMWRMEIASPGSPGAVFHVQVLGRSAPPFPNTLRVPRFPTIVPTPAASIEFLLAELFQDDWPMEFSRSRHRDVWRDIQRRRLRSWLEQQFDALRESEKNSPLLVLKKLEPEADSFIG